MTKMNPECDDTADCSDGSDEAHCGQSACLNWPTGHMASPGSAAGSALWPTVPIPCRHAGLAFTGAGQRKGGSTYDMTRNLSRKQRRESSRCGGEKGRYQADKRSWSNREASNTRNWRSLLYIVGSHQKDLSKGKLQLKCRKSSQHFSNSASPRDKAGTVV